MPDYFMGVDVGSISVDIVIIDADRKILKSRVAPSGASGRNSADRLKTDLLKELAIKERDITYTIATGYGRNLVEGADRTVTEITCHGTGSKYLFDDTDTVLDIGGQDCKAIKLAEEGIIEDFQMNDRCAAGSGRFLEVMAAALETDLNGLNELYFQPAEPVIINATCTVFAESEVVSKLNDGIEPASIVKGIFRTIAERSLQLLSSIKPGNSLTLTGGVAKNRALIEEIKKGFTGRVHLPDDPQIVGAFGAALMAHKIYSSPK